MQRFQVLSLIGGGIRGAFITAYLHRLETLLGRPIAESFDLIAGTSTGAIIAAGLANGLTATELHEFYCEYGAQIFTPRPKYQPSGWWRALYPLVNFVFKRKTGGELDAAFRARFCPHALEDALTKGLGQAKLGSISGARLIIPTYNLTDGRPHLFRSTHLPRARADREVRIVDALIAATAAPTYFPHKMIDGKSFIDGGVWATDPSILAFAEAMRIQQLETGARQFSSCRSENVHLLSIGTGEAQFSLSPPGSDAGLLYWATRVADVMGTAQVQGSHLPLEFVLGDRYQHVNFQMNAWWPLDGVEYIPELFDIGDRRASEDFEMIRKHFLEHQRLPFARNEETDRQERSHATSVESSRTTKT